MFSATQVVFSQKPYTLQQIEQRVVDLLREKLAQRDSEMRKNRPQDFKFEQRLKDGSFADRAAYLVLYLREDILMFQDNLNEIAEQFSQNFRSFFTLIDYVFEIVEVATVKYPLQPLQALLKRAPEGAYYAPENDLNLLYFSAQAKLLLLLQQFMNKLQTALDSGVPNFKKMAIQPLAGLAMIPGFEKDAIALLVQKMSDDDVSGKIGNLLRDIYNEKSEVKVVIAVFEEFYRQAVNYARDYNQRAERILRQCVIFMGFNIKQGDQSLCKEAGRIIINFLHTEMEFVTSQDRESYLVQYCIITLTKLSKISDLRYVPGFEQAIIKLSDMAARATFGFRALIVNFLLSLLYSFQIYKTEVAGFTSTKILDQVIQAIFELLLNASFQFVNNKFYYLGNCVFKLHKLKLAGTYTNYPLLYALWRKMFYSAMSITYQDVVSEVMENYVESVSANMQQCRYVLGQRERNCLFNVSNPSENVFYLKQPYTRCNPDTPAFELLLMKRAVNPACQVFADSLLYERMPEIARLPEDAASPYGIRMYKSIIQGSSKLQFGKGSELNYIYLTWLKRVLSNTIPRKTAGLSDEQIALEAVRRQQRAEAQANPGAMKTELQASPEEEQFEFEEDFYEEEAEQKEYPVAEIVYFDKKMKW